MGKLVWIASYPKSGNTWMRAFLWNYLRNAESPGPLNELSEFAVSESHPERYRRFTADGDLMSLSYDRIAMLRHRVHAAIAETTSGVTFVKAHNYLGSFADCPLYNLQVTGGAIYVVRNPLDVVVSLSDHYGIGLDEAIEFLSNEETAMPTNEIAVAEFLSSWSTHVASWTTHNHPNILVVRYEDLLERPKKAFLSVLKLLDLRKNTDRLNRAVRLSSFRQLRKQEDQHGFRERSEHSRHFFRAGRKDQWRETLSRDQIARVIKRHETQMKRFGYIPSRY